MALTIKQTMDYTRGTTVPADDRAILGGENAIVLGCFHRRSLTSITEDDESGVIGNPVDTSNGTTESGAHGDFPIVGIDRIIEHNMISEIDSPFLTCSKLSNDLDIMHEYHSSMCISRCPGYDTTNFRKRGPDLTKKRMLHHF